MRRNLEAKGLAHHPFQPVAVVGFAHFPPGGKTQPRPGSLGILQDTNREGFRPNLFSFPDDADEFAGFQKSGAAGERADLSRTAAQTGVSRTRPFRRRLRRIFRPPLVAIRARKP